MMRELSGVGNTLVKGNGADKVLLILIMKFCDDR